MTDYRMHGGVDGVCDTCPPGQGHNAAAVIDPELQLPMRHEAIARRVAELVTAELAPAMIPATLRPGLMDGLWRDLAEMYRGRQQWRLNPFPIGPHVIETMMTVDAGRRAIDLQLAVDGGQLVWSGTLHEV